jgi:hypothetical protein
MHPEYHPNYTECKKGKRGVQEQKEREGSRYERNDSQLNFNKTFLLV